MWYFMVGLVWAVWTLSYNQRQRHAVRENWFPIMLFLTLLWPMFMYFAYEKGMAPRLVQDFVVWCKNQANRIY
jgi:hypothetical protein